MEDTVKRAADAAAFRTIADDETHTVHPLSSNESKYGWTQDGKLIRCWLPWQESIAIMGFYAARMVGIDVPDDLILKPARTIANHGIYRDVQGRWRVCYAVRWRTDDAGAPLPDSSYPALGGHNSDVWAKDVNPWWVLPAIKILQRLAPDDPVSTRVSEILDWFGPPKDWTAARWMAV
jgi:hypothetical protein